MDKRGKSLYLMFFLFFIGVVSAQISVTYDDPDLPHINFEEEIPAGNITTFITNNFGSDGNASSICAGDEVLLGNGSCQTSSGFGGGGNPFDQVLNTTSDVEFETLTINNWMNLNVEKEFGGDFVTNNSNLSDALFIGGRDNEGYSIFKQDSGTSPTFCGTAEFNDCYVHLLTDSNGNDADGGLIFGDLGKDAVFEPLLMIKASSKRVGIKTLNPSYTLDVNGSLGVVANIGIEREDIRKYQIWTTSNISNRVLGFNSYNSTGGDGENMLIMYGDPDKHNLTRLGDFGDNGIDLGIWERDPNVTSGTREVYGVINADDAVIYTTDWSWDGLRNHFITTWKGSGIKLNLNSLGEPQFPNIDLAIVDEDTGFDVPSAGIINVRASDSVNIQNNLVVGGKIFYPGGELGASIHSYGESEREFTVERYYTNKQNYSEFDFLVTGQYNGASDLNYTLEIDVINSTQYNTGVGCVLINVGSNETFTNATNYCTYFRWSNDGGATWEDEEILTESSYDLEDGIKTGWNCPSGVCNFTVGDQFNFTAITSPIFNFKIDTLNNLFLSESTLNTFTRDVHINDSLTVDEGVLFVDDVTNRVGINELSPQHDLDVNGDFAIKETLFQVDASGNVNVW